MALLKIGKEFFLLKGVFFVSEQLMPFLLISLILLSSVLIFFLLRQKKNEQATAGQLALLQQSTRELKESQELKETREREELRRMGADIAGRLNEQVNLLNNQIYQMTSAGEERYERIRQEVGQLKQGNVESLEHIRQTVGEKLEVSLEQRISESFKRVSEQLDLVSRGLGEMQALASGVGDLQRLLRNVKVRGTWGEVQLGGILEQMLTKEQYGANVAVKPGSPERVEYAINLPGDGENHVWLPIDAKCPLEDYERLQNAHEAADIAAAQAAGKALEANIKNSAATIAAKYIAPPATTDFAIMFLPLEGLYAEVLQRQGLAESLQRDYRVIVAGPTTLAALLNSLQMGFRSIGVERRAGEVWQVLAAVKLEMDKFAQSLDKTAKKLQEAAGAVESSQRRQRVLSRRLRDVETLPGESENETEVLAEDD